MTKVKSDLLIDIDIVEKCIKGRIFHAFHWYVNASNKYMKDYDKDLCVWTISQKLRLVGFKWVENTYQFNKDCIENWNEDIDEAYFVEVDDQYLEESHEHYNDLSFLPERMKIKKVEKLIINLPDKKDYTH